MNEFDLCSYVATAVVLYGLFKSDGTSDDVMEFGLVLTFVAFLYGLAAA